MALLFFAMTPAAAEAKSFGWQCVPFARMFSGVNLFGNAFTWWNQAVGKYDRGTAPKAGAVLVFKATGAMRVGHVATVSKIVSDRIIKVTHANWSMINGHRGQVENDVTVVDASPANDWSQVKVWYAPIKSIGIKAYPVYGFIYGGKALAKAAGDAARDMGADSAAIADGKSAA
jgi:surface antigen